MPIFIELVTDAFEETFANQATGFSAQKSRSTRAGNRVARRPTRGLEIKEDTHASIKVVLSDGSELPLIDSSQRDGVSSGGYSNFILQSVSEARMEKHQIVETFGASYIFFFGESPRFLDVQAVLINSHDFNWEAEWWENYNENFRGTRLTDKGGRLYLFYDDNIVEGYMLMSNAVKSSTEPHLIQMSFRLFLTNYRNISFIGSTQFPIHDVAISDLIREDPTHQTTTPPGIAGQRQAGLPVRSLISDNVDEYVGLVPNSITAGGSPQTSAGQPLLPPGARTHLDTEDLHQETINQLGNHGANVSSPSALTDLGVMPNFESDARSPATFRPKEKEAFGFNTGGETTSDDVTNTGGNSTTGFQQDPLGAIFGGSLSFGREADNRFTEGTGDAKYGFRSEFSSGPGFGETGFGDFGGPGFGSGQGATGDPGFKDPSRFTFAGVAQNKSAFVKFRKPKSDQSSFGKGAGLAAGSSGLSGGAAVKIGGKVSAFSLISVPGTLKL
jgi:hypothetical protein